MRNIFYQTKACIYELIFLIYRLATPSKFVDEVIESNTHYFLTKLTNFLTALLVVISGAILLDFASFEL